ncbi:MAG: peptidyl-prolyl cis-trans isomerase [Myxococcota bacterium]
MMHTPIISASRALILSLAATVLLTGCKPDAPDLHEARRPVASERAKVAKAAIEAGTAAPAKMSGLTAAQAQSMVARVGDATITLGDVAAYVAQLPRSARSRYVTAEQRVELLRKLVELELLALEGERKGFKTDPVVQHTYKKALADEVLRTVGTDLSLADISEADVTAYYKAHSAEFVREERRRCAVLYSNTRADAVAASAGLKEAIAATPKAAKQIFGDWAREKSVDVASATVKGDLGWFDAKGLNSKGQARVAGLMLSTVFNLEKVHQVSPPLQLESKQWVIVQLTGRDAAKEAPLDDVRLTIQNALLKAKRVEARAAFIKALRGKATITLNEEALAALPTPEPPAAAKVPDVPKPKLPSTAARPTAKPTETKAATDTPKAAAPGAKGAKPRINPALFRRPAAPGPTKRPGQHKAGLSLQHSGPKVPDAAKGRYLGPGQPPAGSDSQETP